MATKTISPEVKKTNLNLQLREALSNAYTAILGNRYAYNISTVTLETMMRSHINEIKGTDGITEIRLNKIDAVDRVVNEAIAAINVAKSLSPDYFKIEASAKEQQEGANVNTPEEPL
ncbi:MAG: hypothetical protein ACFFFC_01055 [Candidatus Thorarchaeota archaeon]